MLSPLRNPTYARLFTAQVIALLGTGLTTVALALLAFELAGENAGLVLGTALAIKMIAYVTLAPIAGMMTRHLPRRFVLIGLDLARAGFVVCLPFVTEVWQVYVLIFLLQACSAGFTPAFQSTIPDVLKEEKEYTKALSLSRLASDLESLASPVLAAALLAL
ncbi:MAG: MFS transporter, partial [Pseudomonadota bacterium]